MKKTIVVSFSGGKTSAYMAKWLIDNKSKEFNLHFVFSNTGLEHEKTLEFIDKCDRQWGLDLTWIEAVTHTQHGKGQTYKIVDFESAARNGQPFELFIKKEGISNVGNPRCSHRLKGIPLDKFRKNISKQAYAAIGIRVDEFDRMNQNYKDLRIMYPLITMKPTTKAEIVHWWSNQNFNLDLPDYLGNCVTCWKKSDRKLLTIAKYDPKAFDFYKRMEEIYPLVKVKDGKKRVWFRGNRSVGDIIAMSKKPFIEYTESIPEWQLDLFGLDRNSGCSESCEAF